MISFDLECAKMLRPLPKPPFSMHSLKPFILLLTAMDVPDAHDVDTYMEALASYHEGEVEPIVKTLVNALELSVFIGGKIARRVDEIVEEWQSLNTDRAGSASYRLPSLLIEHPVVDVSLVASSLGTTDRAARSIVERACERGILTRMGSARRGVLYQASDIIDVLEEVSSLSDIRRMS